MSLYINLICRDVTSDEFFEKTFLCLTPIFLFGPNQSLSFGRIAVSS